MVRFTLNSQANSSESEPGQNLHSQDLAIVPCPDPLVAEPPLVPSIKIGSKFPSYSGPKDSIAPIMAAFATGPRGAPIILPAQSV